MKEPKLCSKYGASRITKRDLNMMKDEVGVNKYCSTIFKY